MTSRMTVRLFARFRELAGSNAIDLLVPPNATVADVRQELKRVWPDAISLLAASAFAVNDDYATDDCVIAPNDDVALIPPVSGGAVPSESFAERTTTVVVRSANDWFDLSQPVCE
jgi:molybdopterin converting factor subunit 1